MIWCEMSLVVLISIVIETISNGDQCLFLIRYLRSLGAVTMAMVFKSANTASGTRILSTTDTNGFRWGQNGTQWIGGFAAATFTVDTVVADTTWHHVVIRFDGTQPDNASKVQVRLDATPSSLTFTGTVGTTTSATSSTFYGGVDSTGNSNYWDGDLGELMFWTRAFRQMCSVLPSRVSPIRK